MTTRQLTDEDCRAKSAPPPRWRTSLIVAFFILLVGLGLHTWFEFAADRSFPHPVICSIVFSAAPYVLFALSSLTPSSFANRLLLFCGVAVLVAFDFLFFSTWTRIGKEAGFDIGFLWLIEVVSALLTSFHSSL